MAKLLGRPDDLFIVFASCGFSDTWDYIKRNFFHKMIVAFFSKIIGRIIRQAIDIEVSVVP